MLSTVIHFFKKRHAISKNDILIYYFGIALIATIPAFFQGYEILYSFIDLPVYAIFIFLIISLLIGIIISPSIAIKGVYSGKLVAGVIKMRSDIDNMKFENSKELKLLLSIGFGTIGFILSALILAIYFFLNLIGFSLINEGTPLLFWSYILVWLSILCILSLVISVLESFRKDVIEKS